jgi:hypothetical protein
MSQATRRKGRRRYYKALAVRTDRHARQVSEWQQRDVRLAASHWSKSHATILTRYQGAPHGSVPLAR